MKAQHSHATAMEAFETTHDRMFADRRDAGLQLAAALMPLQREHPIVLALPRGGVPVAYEVAQALEAPLDVVLVRKIGAPGHAELGIGAMMDGPAPQLVLNEDVVEMVAPEPGYVEREMARQMEEIERCRQAYRDGRPMLDVVGRTVIVVDDGIATGGTVRAVLRGLARSAPARRVLAVPVAPRDALKALATDAEEIVCLSSPDPFFAVGVHYRDFSQTTDAEVIELLAQSRAAPPPN